MSDIIPFPQNKTSAVCPCGDNDEQWCSLPNCPYPCPPDMARFRERQCVRRDPGGEAAE